MQATIDTAFTTRDLLVYVGLPVGGALLGHLWTRYRRRLATLRWTTQYQPMAFATEDFGWGKVEILYEGSPAGTLHIINVQITNESQIDLSNVELDLRLIDGTLVLRSAAQVRGSANVLPFAGGYAGILAQATKRKLTQQELAVWGCRSDFLVPVLNRGDIVDVRLLVARTDHAMPVLTVHCSHLGLRLKHEPPAQQFLGVNQTLASWLGLLVGLVVVVITVRAGRATWLGALAPWLAGALGVLVGASITRALRWVSRMAG